MRYAPRYIESCGSLGYSRVKQGLKQEGWSNSHSAALAVAYIGNVEIEELGYSSNPRHMNSDNDLRTTLVVALLSRCTGSDQFPVRQADLCVGDVCG